MEARGSSQLDPGVAKPLVPGRGRVYASQQTATAKVPRHHNHGKSACASRKPPAVSPLSSVLQEFDCGLVFN